VATNYSAASSRCDAQHTNAVPSLSTVNVDHLGTDKEENLQSVAAPGTSSLIFHRIVQQESTRLRSEERGIALEPCGL